MSGSNWRKSDTIIALIIATFIALPLVWGLTQQETENQYSNINQPTQEYENTYRGPSEGYWWPEFSARDTYAQWAMTLFAFIATVASIWAVILLKRTLEATLSAVRSADDAVEETKKIGQAQTRAYLVPKGGDFIQEERMISFWICIKNSGQTPAYEVRMKSTLDLHHTPFGDDGSVSYQWNDSFREVIESGETEDIWVFFTGINMDFEVIDYFGSASPLFYLSSEISWIDVYGKKHSFLINALEMTDEPKRLTNTDPIRIGKLRCSARVHSGKYDAKKQERK